VGIGDGFGTGQCQPGFFMAAYRSATNFSPAEGFLLF
jgi:hypothetical protein